MVRIRWAATTLAALLLTAGCLSGTGPGTGGQSPDQPRGGDERSGEAVPQLPGNLTLADGHLVERSPHQVSWRWSDALSLGPALSTVEDAPSTMTELTVPPDTWLRVNATLTHPSEGADLDLGISRGMFSLCVRDPISQAREPVTTADWDELGESCEVRPDPAEAWTRWTFTVSAEHWDPRAPAEVPFEVTVTVQALGSAWSDIVPSWSPDRGWPGLQDAAIRPGVKIIHEAGCTSNFVFQDPSNTSLYIGTAAHCADGWGIGTQMGIAGIPGAGRLVYCSWGTMETNATTGCVPPEESLVDTLDNDFAVVEIRPDLRHVVHPALLHWGGPTGLSGEPEPGTRVLLYGNTGLRDGFQSSLPGPADPIEGYVFHPGYNPWETYLHVTGGIPGDSGSAVITETGLALGVLRSFELCDPAQAWSTIADLAPALDFLNDRTGLELELSTWPLLQGSTLPQRATEQQVEPLCDKGA